MSRFMSFSFSFFFFSSRRRHTRLVSDWSSDVCSSDLSASPSPRRESARSGAARPSPSSALAQILREEPFHGFVEIELVLLVAKPVALVFLDHVRNIDRSEERRVGQEGRRRRGMAEAIH